MGYGNGFMALRQGLYLDVHGTAWPWQLSAGWTGVLGYLLGGGDSSVGQLALVVLLMDGLWGAWWRLFQPPLAPREPAFSWLPYATADAPWSQINRVLVPHFFSRLILVTLGVLIIARALSPAAVWASGLALVIALLGGWTARVWRSLSTFVATGYSIGLPLWAGAYLAGEWGMAVALSGALTAASWAYHCGSRWAWLWRGLAVGGWVGIVSAWVPPWLTALTAIAMLLSTVTPKEGHAATLWWGSLGSVVVYYLLRG